LAHMTWMRAPFLIRLILWFLITSGVTTFNQPTSPSQFLGLTHVPPSGLSSALLNCSQEHNCFTPSYHSFHNPDYKHTRRTY
jgi:hypothetical protein